MPTRDENLQAMQGAEEATVLLGLIGPAIGEQVGAAVNLLIAHYRGADLKHDFMVGKIAEISALTALTADLEGRIRAGARASEREFGNASSAKAKNGG